MKWLWKMVWRSMWKIPGGERVILAHLLAGTDDLEMISGVLSPDDFHGPGHKQIFQRMVDMHKRGEDITRWMLANELMKHNELESCGGLAYLVKLDDYRGY
jgi:replicative DNA helicase